MRSRFRLLLIVAAAILVAVPSAAQKRYRAERFDVEMTLQRDGAMSVGETMRFRFEGGAFTRVYRQIPRNRTDGIRNIEGSMEAGQPEAAGSARFAIDRDNGLRAIWRFPGISDGTGTFRLTYLATGVIERTPDADLLMWYLLPTRHDYTIEAATIHVRWPEGGRLSSTPLVTPAGAQVETTPDGITIEARDLGPDATIRLTARFEPGSTAASVPRWQARQEGGQRIAPVMLSVAGVIVLLGIVWALLFLNSHRREPLGYSSDAVVTSPPSDLPVGLAATLAAPGGQASLAQYYGTLFDLARRGAIRMEASGDRTWYRQNPFAFAAGPRPAGLHPHESVVLDSLFLPSGGPRTTVTFSALVRDIRRSWSRFKKAVTVELTERGLVSPERRQTRRRLVSAGVALLIVFGLGMIPAVILANSYEGWPMLIPGSVGVVGFILLITGATYSVLSETGRAEAARWRAFSRYLRGVSRGRAAVTDPAAFEHHLPFALATGNGRGWVQAYVRGGGSRAVPAWFIAPAAADAARQFDAFVALVGATHASGHSAGAGGAAAGAGGGGASGAH